MEMSMFMSFEGRINRAKWWLGLLILVVAALIVSWIVFSIIGVSMMGAMMETGVTAEAIASITRKMAIGQLITTIIIGYPATALMVKRLNDRDRPRFLVYLFWLPTVLTILAGLAGLTMTVTDVGGAMVVGQTGIGIVLGLFSLVIGIWALIELGILKGTPGPNQHGPDPLGGAA